MTKTRKNIRKNITTPNNAQIKLKLKSCKAALYKSVYGGASEGSIRKPAQQLFY